MYFEGLDYRGGDGIGVEPVLYVDFLVVGSWEDSVAKESETKNASQRKRVNDNCMYAQVAIVLNYNYSYLEFGDVYSPSFPPSFSSLSLLFNC